MGRTPMNENIIRNENQTTFGNMQNELSTYNKNVGTLERGGQVGANPYQDPTYLANVNKDQANRIDAATNEGKTALLDANRRGGGGNTGATTGAISGLALNKARMASGMSADRATADYGKNLDWQKYLASAPLAPYSAQSSLAGSTAADMGKYAETQFGVGALPFYEALTKAATQGAAAGATGA